MGNLIDALEANITTASVYGVFTNLMPFVGSMVLVVLGITVLRRVIKGVAKLRIRL